MGSVKRLTKNGRVAPDNDEESNLIASTKSLVAKVTTVNALEDAKGKFDATKAVLRMTEIVTSSQTSLKSLEYMPNIIVANCFGLLYDKQEDMEVQTTLPSRLTSPPEQTPPSRPQCPEDAMLYDEAG
ncbi:hypothetical protein Trydic_g7407 [Trypoxylus dichotomus]